MSTIYDFLRQYGFVDPDRATKISDRCRDREIAVFRDAVSGVIYLDPRRAGLHDSYYGEKQTGGAVNPRSEMDALDTERRSRLLTPFISGRRWVDFGCGPGYQLRSDAAKASAHLGVELSEHDLALLDRDGFHVTPHLAEVDAFSPDVVSMFHVAEHLMDAPGILRALADGAAPGCRLVVEVPHAGDWLIEHGPEAFRQFTFWSEHLVLHTKASMASLLGASGWEVVQSVGVQRYPVWNHLAWLTEGRATGVSAALVDASAAALHVAYEAYLAARDATDTLIVMATRA